jgi:hypothetical protein
MQGKGGKGVRQLLWSDAVIPLDQTPRTRTTVAIELYPPDTPEGEISSSYYETTLEGSVRLGTRSVSQLYILRCSDALFHNPRNQTLRSTCIKIFTRGKPQWKAESYFITSGSLCSRLNNTMFEVRFIRTIHPSQCLVSWTHCHRTQD